MDERNSRRPVPLGPWFLSMRWLDVAFLHWPVPAEALARRLPRGLTLDTFQGTAWLSVVPLVVEGARLRWFPPLPGVSSYLELSVRTFVTDGRRPGIWCLSVDADSALVVRAARIHPRLPYLRARLAHVRGEGWVHFACWRTHRGAKDASFSGRFKPLGSPFEPVPGSLEAWLTDRTSVFTEARDGRLLRTDLDVAPWQIRPCEADLQDNTMAGPLELLLPRRPALAHYVSRQDVRVWRARSAG
ncbi:MAG TPA: DUF2071 domain-containing protein [Holophaga sp.]|nr:DUF2071 domain-containing protein [Holophaga sp.]